MSGEVESAGDVLTGGLVARAIEREAGARSHGNVTGKCLNCGASLNGAYCAACGQSAHIHRSVVSLGHDILHAVFHFEGRIWRTIPELFLHPGRLTRRYIDGERAKFVSPMALFLFTAFLMFAAFSFTGGALLSAGSDVSSAATNNWKSNVSDQIAAIDVKIAAVRSELAAPEVTEQRRAELNRQIEGLESTRLAMDAMVTADWGKFVELEKRTDGKNTEQGTGSAVAVQGVAADFRWKALERRLNEGLKHVSENPSLLLYKLKTNGYKFSWALIPLSLPFLWLLFFWRRDVHLYDHAIFATYSITFMMLLVILLSIAAAAGVGPGIWGTALVFIPPIHMYRQLRGAYHLSRFGALVRLFFLLIATSVVLTLFTLLLLLLGVLG